MLYSDHKESGLIRISLFVGLGGPGWARGCTWTEKSREAQHGLLLKMEYAPALPSWTLIRRPGLSFWGSIFLQFSPACWPIKYNIGCFKHNSSDSSPQHIDVLPGAALITPEHSLPLHQDSLLCHYYVHYYATQKKLAISTFFW